MPRLALRPRTPDESRTNIAIPKLLLNILMTPTEGPNNVQKDDLFRSNSVLNICLW